MMDIRSLTTRQARRQQPMRGSLPLKKRIASYSLRTASPHLMLDHSNKTATATGCDETLAALALIQASSGAADAPVSQYQSERQSADLPLLPHMEREHDARLSLLSLHRRVFVHESSAPTSTLFVPDVPGTNSSQQRPTEDTIEVSTSASDITMGTRSIASFSSIEERDSHQSPHGRSPSAISRRLYPVESLYAVARRGKQRLGLQLKPPVPTAPISSPVYTPQDKRFTGLSYEVRCKATTTRGRACAYVAANGTEFCNLHAQHQNNKFVLMEQHQQPQVPRFGETRKKKTTTKEQRIDRSATAMAAPDAEGASSKLPSPLAHLTLDKKPRGRRASKLAEKHAASPFFLLSMIPSDQWRGKNVSILTGPMKDEEGIVEKWSNGWVSVRIPNIGIHNRRSIELAIVETTEVSTERHETRPSSVSRPVERDAANPSPCSDLDLSHASPHTGYNHVQSETITVETPRTIVINVYRDTETPAINAEYTPIPSVTPGSTNSAFHVPVVDFHNKVMSQTSVSNIGDAKAGEKRTEASPSFFHETATAVSKKHRFI